MGLIESKNALRWAALAVSVAAGIGASDIWRVRPGESYDPDTYCRWNRSGLPPAQQKICEARGQRSPSHKPHLRTLEADNGSRFAIDLNSIVHDTDGGAEIVAYMDDGVRRLIFDCSSHYMDAHEMVQMYAPPRSVIGAIQKIACKR